MQNTRTSHGWQRAVVALSATVITAVVVGTLYWAQVVLIPLGLAVFLTFLLNPSVRALERRGLGRTPSVTTVVLVVALLLTSMGWLLARQTTDLVADLPKYSATIRQKIESLRGIGAGAKRVLGEIADDFKTAPPKDAQPPNRDPHTSTPAAESPLPVVVQSDIPPWLAHLPAYLGSMAGALGGLVIVLVLVFFMLLRREDLRNRFLRLAGRGRMSLTTKAVDDAGQRISRFLLMQALVNAAVGIALALGLLAIGVERAFLWGLLAGVLRYIPYLGIWIAVVLLLPLCLAIFPSWLPALLVLGLFLIVELLTANLLEPRLLGQSIGVSEIAFLAAALFWGFLWGPIGLVLSSPLTVCLLVMGKHIPALEFLEIMLGDEPALIAPVSYYQRLVARDQDEATELIITHAQEARESIYDEFLVPALQWAKRDRQRGELTEADEQFIAEATREIMEEWSAAAPGTTPATREGAAEWGSAPPPLVMPAFPARDAADRVALEMLQQLLDPGKWQCDIAAADTLPAEFVGRIADEPPPAVCISALPPGGLARTRYLCKLLRKQAPHTKIFVGLWELAADDQARRQELHEAGADFVATTLLEMRNHLNSQFRVLTGDDRRADVVGSV